MNTGQSNLKAADSSGNSSRPLASAGVPNARPGLWAFLALDLWVRLLVWSTSLGWSVAAMSMLGGWPAGNPLGGELGVTMHWAQRITHWTILFNLIYVVELLILRLLVPTPREGVYSTSKPGLPDRQLVWTCLVGALTKARLKPPFPGFLVFHIANLPPMCWIFGRLFGPRSRSCYATEPVIIDPHLVEIGRNVTIGLDAIISGHVQGPDRVTLKRTIIEDDVLIGGRAIIMAGCHLQKGCVIGAEAMLRPGTVVGPNEFWGGLPARKIGMVHEVEDASSAC